MNINISTKEINFDMDGTLCNFYGVQGWLDDLNNSNTRPYAIAQPLFNFNVLARYLNRLQTNGYKINIISWLSKNGTLDYNERVTETKKKWLKKHLKSVKFDNITIIEYGTPKQNYGKGILFDDEEKNRSAWNGVAFDEKNILEILKTLLTKC